MAELYRLDCVPGVGAYCAALVQPFVNDTHRHILGVHAAASGRLASAGALAAPFGRRHPFINIQYGRLGHGIADFLGLKLPRYSKGPLWTAAVAEGGYTKGGRWWYWRMYPEVAQAIRRLGWETSFGGAPMSRLLDDMRGNPAADWRIPISNACAASIRFGVPHHTEVVRTTKSRMRRVAKSSPSHLGDRSGGLHPQAGSFRRGGARRRCRRLSIRS